MGGKKFPVLPKHREEPFVVIAEARPDEPSRVVAPPGLDLVGGVDDLRKARHVGFARAMAGNRVDDALVLDMELLLRVDGPHPLMEGIGRIVFVFGVISHDDVARGNLPRILPDVMEETGLIGPFGMLELVMEGNRVGKRGDGDAMGKPPLAEKRCEIGHEVELPVDDVVDDRSRAIEKGKPPKLR